jgi:hypothetical protein
MTKTAGSRQDRTVAKQPRPSRGRDPIKSGALPKPAEAMTAAILKDIRENARDLSARADRLLRRLS